MAYGSGRQFESMTQYQKSENKNRKKIMLENDLESYHTQSKEWYFGVFQMPARLALPASPSG